MAQVLVIDDEPGVRDLLRQMLEEAGHSVVEAANGKTGLWIFQDARPDLAIVDLFMPEKEGIETIQEMRAADPQAKIIAVSGGGTYGLIDLLDDVTELGATSTLAKPFRAEQLYRAVEQALAPVEQGRSGSGGSRP